MRTERGKLVHCIHMSVLLILKHAWSIYGGKQEQFHFWKNPIGFFFLRWTRYHPSLFYLKWTSCSCLCAFRAGIEHFIHLTIYISREKSALNLGMTTRSKCWLISSLYTSTNSILQRGNSWIQFCQFMSHCVCSTLDLVSEALLCWVYADWSAIDWLNSWNHIICQGDHRTPQIICATELDLKRRATIFPLHFKNGKYETFCNTDSQQHQTAVPLHWGAQFHSLWERRYE